MTRRSRKQRIGAMSRAERVERNEQRKQAARYARARDEALLSLDKATIIDFWDRTKTPVADAIRRSDALFWYHVHKQRSQIKSLPLAERRASIAWLKENGLKVESEL